jgi:hypothetical protein
MANIFEHQPPVLNRQNTTWTGQITPGRDYGKEPVTGPLTYDFPTQQLAYNVYNTAWGGRGLGSGSRLYSAETGEQIEPSTSSRPQNLRQGSRVYWHGPTSQWVTLAGTLASMQGRGGGGGITDFRNIRNLSGDILDLDEWKGLYNRGIYAPTQGIIYNRETGEFGTSASVNTGRATGGPPRPVTHYMTSVIPGATFAGGGGGHVEFTTPTGESILPPYVPPQEEASAGGTAAEPETGLLSGGSAAAPSTGLLSGGGGVIQPTNLIPAGGGAPVSTGLLSSGSISQAPSAILSNTLSGGGGQQAGQQGGITLQQYQGIPSSYESAVQNEFVLPQGVGAGNYSQWRNQQLQSYRQSQYNGELSPGEYPSLSSMLPGSAMTPVQRYVPGVGMQTFMDQSLPEYGQGSVDIDDRSSQIGEEFLRDSKQWAVPDSTEGPYRYYDVQEDGSLKRRSGWTAKSSEDIRSYIGKKRGDKNSWIYKEGWEQFQTDALADQAQQQQNYAKYRQETQAAYSQTWAQQQYMNQMAKAQQWGQSQFEESDRRRRQLQANVSQGLFSRGMSGTTAAAAGMRTAEEFAAQDRQRVYDNFLMRSSSLQNMAYDRMNQAMHGVVSQGPDMGTMANIMFQAGAAPQTQPQQEGPSATTTAAVGVGAGLLGGLLGGCFCQLFLEGRHGDGTMDWVVRKYRDESMTSENARGYYKMSQVCVPLMRKSKLFSLLVMLFIIEPLFSYGRWYYRKEIRERGEKVGIRGRIGWVFAPVKSFWMKTWEYLGGEHPFVRWNGETV